MSSQRATLETTLHALLPTTNFLPPDLLSLTTSLLTQSKSKARNLKPEEEIARIYAVSHIAIEKHNASNGGEQPRRRGPGRPRLVDEEELQGGEMLELGKIMPPCKPKVYAKLKKFLDGVLVLSGRRSEPTTPKGKEADEKSVEKASGKRKRGAEEDVFEGSEKAKRIEWGEKDVGTPNKKVERQSARKLANEGKGKTFKKEVPGWVAGLIRGLCQGMNLPKASPHVFVGVETLFQGRLVSEQDLLDYVLAVFLFAAASMQALDVQDEDAVAALREQAVTAFQKAHAAESKGQKDDDALPGLPEEEQLQKDLDELLKTAAKDSWVEMEWYDNVPAGEDVDEDEAETPRKILPPAKTPLNRREKRALFDAEGEELPGLAGLLPGLGTMFQPSINWLSEERRADFEAWKQDVLKEIEQQA